VTAAITAVAPEAAVDAIDPQERLRESLDLDSLDFLSVIEHLAKDTGVSVPERDYARVDSLEGLVAYVAARG
jgi:acyl carrier protein